MVIIAWPRLLGFTQKMQPKTSSCLLPVLQRNGSPQKHLSWLAAIFHSIPGIYALLLTPFVLDSWSSATFQPSFEVGLAFLKMFEQHFMLPPLSSIDTLPSNKENRLYQHVFIICMSSPVPFNLPCNTVK